IGKDQVILERGPDGGERRVRIETSAGTRHVYRVTRVVGGRTREDFVGVELERSRRVAEASENGLERSRRVAEASENGPERSRRVAEASESSPERSRRVAEASENGPSARGDEQVLPVSYLLFSRELRYKGYSV